MKILGILDYSQINSAIKDGFIDIFGIKFILHKDTKQFLATSAGKITRNGIVGQNSVLLAVMDPTAGNVIVMFSPNGPPDPGLQI